MAAEARDDHLKGFLYGFVLGDVLGAPFRYSRRRKFYGICEPVIKSSGFTLGVCSPTLHTVFGLPCKSKSVSAFEIECAKLVLTGNVNQFTAYVSKNVAIADLIKLTKSCMRFDEAMAVVF